MSIYREYRSPVYWTADQQMILELLWGLIADEKLGALIGRTPMACYQRAMVLGLRKWDKRRREREGRAA